MEKKTKLSFHGVYTCLVSELPADPLRIGSESYQSKHTFIGTVLSIVVS